MNQEAYENFVARIEAESQRNPAFYQIRLGGLAILGYAYVATVLLLLLGVLVLFGWMLMNRSGSVLAVKLGIVVIPLVWAVINAMFVRLTPPTGREVTPQDAPALFRFIADVRRRTGAPAPHRVLITEDFNAAVVQHPRLGIFGWPRNYLILGLPLLQALSVEEFRAVVAHEFGHLSGAHGKFGAWIYRLRAGWARLAAALSQGNHWGKFLFVPFFNWYAPTFSAYSFVQARRQEYEADRVSLLAAGKSIVGMALVRVELQAQFLHGEYWKNIFRQADAKPQPDTRPFSSMRRAFMHQQAPLDSNPTLEAALRRKTGFDDTHPCLADRLRALGVSPAAPGPVTISAAESLLGPLGEGLATEFDRRWHEKVSEWWHGRHQYVAESRPKLAELDEVAGNSELSVDDAFGRAKLTEELISGSSALPQLEALAARAPQHAPTLFALGRLKLDNNDETGIALLQQAARLDPAAAQVAGSLVVDYLKRQGRNKEARPYLDQVSVASETEAQARRERRQLLPSDRLLPHGLPIERLQTLITQLRQHQDIRLACLVRKQTRHYSDVPMYVLGVQRQTQWWKPESSAAAHRLVQRLCEQLTFPGETLVVCLDGSNKEFRTRVRKIPEALLYPQRQNESTAMHANQGTH